MSRLLLDIPPGVITDETTFATPYRWSDANNVRFWRGKPQTLEGSASWNSSSNLTGQCRALIAWTGDATTPSNVDKRVAFGTNTKLFAYKSADVAPSDITPSSGFTSGNIDASSVLEIDQPLIWTLQTWGSYLIANPRGQGIFVWNGNTASRATLITNAPAKAYTILSLPEQRMLLAFGCNEEASGAFNPLCIRNCDAEDYTNWTTAGSLASETILSQGGRIIGARLIGQFIAVWTEDSLYLGQYVGSTLQTFRFDLVGVNCGLIGPNAVTVFNGTAYWVTPDRQFMQWQPGTLPTPIPCPIWQEFVKNLDRLQGFKIFMAAMSKYQEIWCFYPDARDGDENSRAVFFSTIDGSWSKSDYARSAMIDADVYPYPMAINSGSVEASPLQPYLHEVPPTTDYLGYRAAPPSWSLRSGDFYLDDATRWVMVKGMWPDFEYITPVETSPTENFVSFRLYLRDKPQSTASAFPTAAAKALYTTTTKYDFMAQGRIAQIDLSGTNCIMRLGRPSFDVQPTGQN